MNATSAITALAGAGMSCTGPTDATPTPATPTVTGLQQWTCTNTVGVAARVEMVGASATQVTAIRARIDNARGNEQVAATVLATVAGVAFDTATATQARDWVRANIANGGQTTISGTMIVIAWEGNNLTMAVSAA